MQELQGKHVPSLGRGDSLEEEVATHSSILAWTIPWTVEPGRPQSVGLQRVGHDRERLLIKLHFLDSYINGMMHVYPIYPKTKGILFISLRITIFRFSHFVH